jgi:hypothetical protein
MAFCSSLTFVERKGLITLARSQSIPDPFQSPILFSKVRPILDRLCLHPPFENLSEPLLEEGHLILRILSSSITAGLLIVYALGTELSDNDVREGVSTAFSKELLATQTRRLPSEWNWTEILSPSWPRDAVIHPSFPDITNTQLLFSSKIGSIKQRYSDKIILPHYTRRGISSETSKHLLNRVHRRVIRKVHGPLGTFHRNLDRRNVRSLDVVHHYIRTGEWSYGRTEMKQRWYPSGILPRTYFAWSGKDIAASCYLRNFFNDLGDIFPPTHRHTRVQPDYLSHRTRTEDGGFLFYDLTSFTSWFHEHEPFLRAVAEKFSDTNVFLVGEGLSLREYCLGDLIHGYVDYVNSFPEFCVSGNIKIEGIRDISDRTFSHLCAGFLGIVGNLITCTIPHGLALSSLVEDISEIQVPGDDVGICFDNADHMKDIGTCAGTLGKLQFEKVYSTPGICVYLKRLVLDLGDRIDLAPMLIFPLLPYLVNPVKNYNSNRFRLPPPKVARSRAASVLVSFRRDIWKLTHGDISDDVVEILHLFERRVHEMVGLPFDAIFQGMVYSCDYDEEDEDNTNANITIKFSCVHQHHLVQNPDMVFASKYLIRMTIRSIDDVSLTPAFSSLKEGQTVIVNTSKAWKFLEDMGYVKIVGIPGEKIHLVGSDARDAYLFSTQPSLREVVALGDVSFDQLYACGIIREGQSEVFEGLDDSGSRHVDLNTRSWRYRKYVDLDDPGSAGLYGRSRDWVGNHIASLRSSLSPEPQDTYLDY